MTNRVDDYKWNQCRGCGVKFDLDENLPMTGSCYHTICRSCFGKTTNCKDVRKMGDCPYCNKSATFRTYVVCESLTGAFKANERLEEMEVELIALRTDHNILLAEERSKFERLRLKSKQEINELTLKSRKDLDDLNRRHELQLKELKKQLTDSVKQYNNYKQDTDARLASMALKLSKTETELNSANSRLSKMINADPSYVKKLENLTQNLQNRVRFKDKEIVDKLDALEEEKNRIKVVLERFPSSDSDSDGERTRSRRVKIIKEQQLTRRLENLCNGISDFDLQTAIMAKQYPIRSTIKPARRANGSESEEDELALGELSLCTYGIVEKTRDGGILMRAEWDHDKTNRVLTAAQHNRHIQAKRRFPQTGNVDSHIVLGTDAIGKLFFGAEKQDQLKCKPQMVTIGDDSNPSLPRSAPPESSKTGEKPIEQLTKTQRKKLRKRLAQEVANLSSPEPNTSSVPPVVENKRTTVDQAKKQSESSRVEAARQQPPDVLTEREKVMRETMLLRASAKTEMVAADAAAKQRELEIKTEADRKKKELEAKAKAEAEKKKKEAETKAKEAAEKKKKEKEAELRQMEQEQMQSIRESQIRFMRQCGINPDDYTPVTPAQHDGVNQLAEEFGFGSISVMGLTSGMPAMMKSSGGGAPKPSTLKKVLRSDVCAHPPLRPSNEDNDESPTLEFSGSPRSRWLESVKATSNEQEEQDWKTVRAKPTPNKSASNKPANSATAPQSKEETRPTRTVFIYPLPNKADWAAVKNSFIKYGNIEKIYCPVADQRNSLPPPVYALVCYTEPSSAKKAASSMNGNIFCNEKVNVSQTPPS